MLCRIAFSILLALCSSIGWAKAPPPFIPDTKIQSCQITSVHDGDSMRVRCPGQKKTIPIRLAQLDAPELDQAHGLKSRDYLRSICMIDKEAVIHSRGQDRYRRTLAEVYCDDVHANAALIKNGHAWVYDNYVQDQVLYQTQKTAQAQRLGLWADRDAIAPWTFRRSRP